MQEIDDKSAAVSERPPPLEKLEKWKSGIEAGREEIYSKLKAALEAANGNMREASDILKITHDRVRYLTRKLGLSSYARDRRVAAGQTKDGRGRPKK